MALFLLTFVNCEDTITPEPEQQEEDVLQDVLPRVETMTYESVPQNFNKLKGHFKLSKHLEGDTEFSKNTSSKNDIIIHTDVVKEVTLGDYKSYTMRITMPNAPSNKLFNLTVEEKNGKEGLFLTIYTSKSVTAKGGSVDAGSVETRRYHDFETIPPYVEGEDANAGTGGSAGGGGSTSGEATLEYPYNCNGDIIIQPNSARVPYQCTCNDHWPWQGCDCPVYGGEAPGYNYVDGYLCVPHDDGGDPDMNTGTTNTNTGGSSSGAGSGDNDTPSIAVIVDDETPCDPAPPGDLNGDCKVERYEVCLNSLNNRLVSRLSEENFNAIINYLNKEGCGDNSGFINSAIEALVNDGEVDFENELIIDKSFKDTKAHCVLKTLISSNNNILKER
ncbi:hypothetical protein CLV33_105324 [Jejuia pallidilutea]|uniref:Uncharacterized protein n=1 Tax=Jejuia pallidilutea TaxID=504487 RepID=A0A362X0D3_9FLAO|nr:hypothetical protein [Jejuia pallidilutea]PQV48464.1 hypothetical protein CLV33_105324 [Jejuia pallidilutea]